jgi:predicted Fe-S protein YdhL (DUF1289 family)
MGYAGPRGIPRSIFLGRVWPNPADPEEPQWLPEDFEAALDWAEFEANKCPGCGRQRDECFADDGPDYEGEALVCWSCHARDVKAQQMTGPQPGTFFVAREAVSGD